MTPPSGRGRGHGKNYESYRIVPRDGGDPVDHARATTVAGVLDDRFFLEQWGKRMVALGLVARPDLLALASVSTADDKKTLNGVCRDAVEAAKASKSANLGNALHKLTERVDSGEDVKIPAVFKKDFVAYHAMLAKNEIEIDPRYVERVCVNDSLDEPVAGTTDRFVKWNGDWYVGDLKTGANLHFGWRKIAIQLAIYARSSSLYDRETETHEDLPPVDQERAIVFHLPVGKGACTAHFVDITAGWRAAKIAVAVRAWREGESLNRPLEGGTE